MSRGRFEVEALLDIGLAGPNGEGLGFVGITAGSSHTCGIGDGTALCWGSNRFGQLGDGTRMNRPTPTPVGS